MGAASVLAGHHSQFRMRWLATRLHLFIIAAVAPVVTVETLSRFTEAAMDYASQNKGGLPAGFQTGVAVFAALISDRVEPDAAAWASRQRLKFACVGRPAVIDTGTGQVRSGQAIPSNATHRFGLRQISANEGCALFPRVQRQPGRRSATGMITPGRLMSVTPIADQRWRQRRTHA